MNYMTAKKSKRNVVKSKKTKFTSFLFAVVLTFSVILVAMSFKYATLFRMEQGVSGNSIGGEVFTIALPIILLYVKTIIEEKRNRAEIQEYSQVQRKDEM